MREIEGNATWEEWEPKIMGLLSGRLSTECSATGVPNIRTFYESFLVKKILRINIAHVT